MTRKETAYHEAGHAVIGRLLGLQCGHVTIIPDDDEEFGHAQITNPLQSWQRGDGSKRSLADNFCIALYAGAEAEKRLLGSNAFGDGTDASRVRNCLTKIRVPGARFVGDDAWERYEDRLRSRARHLVQIHCLRIKKVAEALLARGTLQAAEVQAIIEE